VNSIDVWRASLDNSAAEISALWNLLSVAEQHRARQFHREIDSTRYIVCRGTLRSLLAEYTSTPPRLVPIRVLPNGKPSLPIGRNTQTLHFNLSHCGGRALFAFSDHEVGIDIQRVETNDDLPRVVANFFSPGEVATFDRLEESERERFFFRTWVRKEAYLKATGEGLRTDPAKLFVGDLQDGEVRLTDQEGTTHVDRAYQVYDIDGLKEHVGAIAVAAPLCPPTIRILDWTPADRDCASFQLTGLSTGVSGQVDAYHTTSTVSATSMIPKKT